MKTIIASIIVAAALLVPTATATEDLGEPSVFQSACRSILDVGRASDIEVVKCRRRAPDEAISPFSALIHVTVWDRSGTKFDLDIWMNKSLWQVSAFKQAG